MHSHPASTSSQLISVQPTLQHSVNSSVIITHTANDYDARAAQVDVGASTTLMCNSKGLLFGEQKCHCTMRRDREAVQTVNMSYWTGSLFGFLSGFLGCENAHSYASFFQEQYIFIHQCVQLMWQKKKQQFCISDVIYENVSKS